MNMIVYSMIIERTRVFSYEKIFFRDNKINEMYYFEICLLEEINMYIEQHRLRDVMFIYKEKENISNNQNNRTQTEDFSLSSHVNF